MSLRCSGLLHSSVRLRASATLLASSLALALSCSQCDTGFDSLGNIDRVSDVVVVVAPDGVSYSVTANPDLQHLRIVDLTQGKFLQSPNRFFPLSPPSAARQLAVAVDATTTAADGSRVFGLDGTTDRVDIIHTSDDADDAARFGIVGGFDVGRAAADIAALRIGTTTLVAVTVPDDGSVEIYAVDDAHAAALLTTVALPAGAHPFSIVADPLGHAFIVGDAALPQVHALEPNADGSAVVLARSLDVGGTVGALAAGVVDVGDGIAPVALVLRSDRAAAVLVRLYRPTYPEDRYAVLGGTELPKLGVTAYVPDVRPTAAPTTICCEGMSKEQIAAGEASADYAAVTVADGNLLYLQLAAKTVDGLALGGTRRAVRLFDDDAAPPGPGVIRDSSGAVTGTIDVNVLPELWVPGSGGADRRPTVTFATRDAFGSPPFVRLLPTSSSVLLVWQGDLPTATDLAGTFAAGTARFDAGVDLVARDVRVGDIARLQTAGALLDCPTSFRAQILAVDGTAIVVATDADGGAAVEPALSDLSCLVGSGTVSLTVEVGGAWVAPQHDVFLQRLAFAEPLTLPGVELTLTAAAAGLPVSGSRLAVPLDPRVRPLGLALPLLSTRASASAMIPTGIAGGTVVIRDRSKEDLDATVAARRLVLSSGAVDPRSAVPLLFSCDEAETSTTSVDILR